MRRKAPRNSANRSGGMPGGPITGKPNVSIAITTVSSGQSEGGKTSLTSGSPG